LAQQLLAKWAGRVGKHQIAGGLISQQQGAFLDIQQIGDLLDDQRRHPLGIERRCERPSDLIQRRKLVCLASALLIQTRVIERHCGLGGDRQQHIDMLIAVAVSFAVGADAHHADQPIARQQRHAKPGARLAQASERARLHATSVTLCGIIVGADRLTFAHNQAR